MSSKVAVVTGAGSGIGRAVSLALIDEGYHVLLAGRRADKLAETAALAQRSCTAVPCDVADECAVKNLFRRAQHERGRVDVLFNNAGISSPAAPIDEVSLATWHGKFTAERQRAVDDRDGNQDAAGRSRLKGWSWPTSFVADVARLPSFVADVGRLPNMTRFAHELGDLMAGAGVLRNSSEFRYGNLSAFRYGKSAAFRYGESAEFRVETCG